METAYDPTRRGSAPPEGAGGAKVGGVPSVDGVASVAKADGVAHVEGAHDELLARAIAGDTAAFRGLYARHRAEVARLVYRMVGREADLDDVIQEVFFQVFRSLKDFRGQAKFTTWLHRVTVNVVLMHRRAARSRPTYAEEKSQELTPDDASAAPDETTERRERMRAFARVLDKLADKKRVVFVLHELEGMSPAEIAKAVGAPVLTIRTRLFYARRELEALFADEPSLAGLALGFSRGASDAGEARGAGPRALGAAPTVAESEGPEAAPEKES